MLRVVLSVRWTSRRGLSSHEATSRFLEFFEGRQHAVVPSSPLLAPPETGLLFTNSGMNQFHRILSGYEAPVVKRVASLQDCVRVGGKHNDLSEVGLDGHHHTFFQMLGNWSFGDYFKDEACGLALELLTVCYGLRKDDLVVTHFGGDADLGLPCDFETRDIWLRLGFPERAVLAKGVRDNFWEMGKTGPCGPCTEIHVVVDGQLREIWNLVFVQYNRLSDGSLRPLETPFVDTGMGLERLCALLQGKSSNYDTDLFRPMIQYLEKTSGKTYGGSFTSLEDCAFRLVADHGRMAAKSIDQGILPDHVDAGNKLRQVIRRATHAARDRLRLQPGVVSNTCAIAAESLKLENIDRIKSIVDEEERRYIVMLKKADGYLKEEDGVETLSGTTAWKLYQLCGLPKDNIVDICSQRGIKDIDWAQFDQHLEDFKRKSVGPNVLAKFNLPKHIDSVTKRKLPVTDYSAVYCNRFEMHSEILYAGQEGPDCVVVTRETCFYPESGGQVSDVGTLCSSGSESEVVRVVKVGEYLYHLCSGRAPLEHSSVEMKVDVSRRRNCTQHHTAVHLLNAALKEQLGAGAVQRSSLVDGEHFRLEIASRSAVDVKSAEDFINNAIKLNHAVKWEEVEREIIMNDSSIIKLPNEVYPAKVRLVQCGDVSKEPCCGTHVNSTGEIPPVVIVGSRSAGANVKIVRATASRAHVARANAAKVHQEVEQLEKDSESLSDDYREIQAASTRVRALRNFIAAELMPHLDTTKSLMRLERIDARVVKLTRQNSKRIEPEIRARLDRITGQPAVGSISFDCDESVVRKTMKERGTSSFVILESCGRVHVLCRVTQSESFTAKRWVASFMETIGPCDVHAHRETDFVAELCMDPVLPLEQLEHAARAVSEKLKAD
ncbi:uncharacterized protein LOC100899008 [Galendromus occidentalis]|uniref:Alanine--tRNA ligase n=1 Tax=Galendromus occidentalis TaxID=34638 RepID=A0AAJ6W0B5_9ACAR|nr:uncharacterized protein LOC100899008 [Galendromus occidentalis]